MTGADEQRDDATILGPGGDEVPPGGPIAGFGDEFPVADPDAGIPAAERGVPPLTEAEEQAFEAEVDRVADAYEREGREVGDDPGLHDR
jgi:signal peptidase II